MANYTLHMIWNLFGKEHSNTFNWESDLTVDLAKLSLFLFLKITSLQMIEGAIFFLLIDKRA